MKKLVTGVLALLICVTGTVGAQNTGAAKKILVVYFSMPLVHETDAVTGASVTTVDGKVSGDVQFIAETIQHTTGGDIFRIETLKPYPTRKQALLDYTAAETKNKRRPAIAAVPDLSQYDAVFIGYPMWNYDLPMPIYSFLESVDLSGKTLVPFNSHGGSNFSGTVRTIMSLEPNARVLTTGFTVTRNRVANAASDVSAWVRTLDFAK